MSVSDIANGINLSISKLPVGLVAHAATAIDEAATILHWAVGGDSEISGICEAWTEQATILAETNEKFARIEEFLEAYKAKIGAVVPSPGLGAAVGGSGDPVAANGNDRAILPKAKFRYFFGKVDSNDHNEKRSGQLLTELNRILVTDKPEGHVTLQRHLREVVSSDTNIVRRFTNRHGSFQVRDSLLAGPGGFVQLHTTWHETSRGLKISTIIPFRGKK